MTSNKHNRKIVIVNQAVNYLTIGICNAFAEQFEKVSLITGSIHEQGEELSPEIKVTWINQWHEKPAYKKLLSYCWALIRIYWLLLFKYRNYEVFFVSVPPMAYLLGLFLHRRYSMLIWDVYPDVFKITGMQESHPIYKIWCRLNKKVFHHAYRIFTIGEKMSDLVANYVEREKINLVPLWAIEQEKPSVSRSENPFVIRENLQEKFVVQYSGNIGLTHNVEVMIDLAEYLNGHEHILFQIIGRGPRAPILERMVREKGLNNCQFLPFQSDEMFPYSLSAANLGVVILNELTSKGSVPSKSYNLMRFGIPSLYIASKDSELNAYSQKFEHGRCFNVSNLQAAADFILKLSDDEDLQQKYSQNAIKASKHFTRDNADYLVKQYIE